MMKLHSKKDIYYYYKVLLFSLFPLIIYGIIKNGIILYKETSNWFIIFKPLIFLGISLCFGFISDLIIYKGKKIGKNLVYLTFLFMISSINTPLIIYIIANLLLIFFLYKDKNIINKIALVSLLIYGYNYFFKSIIYENLIELSGQYVFSFIDMIFIRQVGGIATSNFILVMLLLITLLFNIYYKKNIALFGLLSYIFYFVLMAILKDPILNLEYLINATAAFQIITIAPLNEYSPYNPKGEIIYGLLIGLFGALLCNFVNFNIGVMIAIIVLTPLKLLFEKNKLFF